MCVAKYGNGRAWGLPSRRARRGGHGGLAPAAVAVAGTCGVEYRALVHGYLRVHTSAGVTTNRRVVAVAFGSPAALGQARSLSSPLARHPCLNCSPASRLRVTSLDSYTPKPTPQLTKTRPWPPSVRPAPTYTSPPLQPSPCPCRPRCQTSSKPETPPSFAARRRS